MLLERQYRISGSVEQQVSQGDLRFKIADCRLQKAKCGMRIDKK
jgi:hypothetical protein